MYVQPTITTNVLCECSFSYKLRFQNLLHSILLLHPWRCRIIPTSVLDNMGALNGIDVFPSICLGLK